MVTRASCNTVALGYITLLFIFRDAFNFDLVNISKLKYNTKIK